MHPICVVNKSTILDLHELLRGDVPYMCSKHVDNLDLRELLRGDVPYMCSEHVDNFRSA